MIPAPFVRTVDVIVDGQRIVYTHPDGRYFAYEVPLNATEKEHAIYETAITRRAQMFYPDLFPDVEEDSFEAAILRGECGPLITGADGLGLFIGTPDQASECPAGWVFVDKTTATVAQVRDAVIAAKAGRTNWPTRAILT